MALRLLRPSLLVLYLIPASNAWPHIRLVDPTPRTEEDGLKSAPCGGIPKSELVTSFTAGEAIVVTWEETVNHPGWYRIAFSEANDEGFDDHVLADNIPDEEGTGTYSHIVTLPDISCDGCTLQLIQVMTDKSMVDGEYQKYYSCADLVLSENQEESLAPELSPTPTEESSSTETPATDDSEPPWETPANSPEASPQHEPAPTTQPGGESTPTEAPTASPSPLSTPDSATVQDTVPPVSWENDTEDAAGTCQCEVPFRSTRPSNSIIVGLCIVCMVALLRRWSRSI